MPPAVRTGAARVAERLIAVASPFHREDHRIDGDRRQLLRSRQLPEFPHRYRLFAVCSPGGRRSSSRSCSTSRSYSAREISPRTKRVVAVSMLDRALRRSSRLTIGTTIRRCSALRCAAGHYTRGFSGPRLDHSSCSGPVARDRDRRSGREELRESTNQDQRRLTKALGPGRIDRQDAPRAAGA